MKSNYQILIIGGGTAGIMSAAQLLKKDKNLDIGLIEPSETHYYQPAWTLVGAGSYDFEKTSRPMKSIIPKDVTWIKDYATGFDPENNLVLTKSSGNITYNYLIVAPGLSIDTSLIEGLPEAIDKGLVCSNYIDPKYTWEVIKNFEGGNAVFTQPATPIKCGGAAQKTTYLASHYFKKRGLLDKTNVIFATPGTVIFGVEPIKKTLLKVVERYGIHFRPLYIPFKIDTTTKEIYFRYREDKAKKPLQLTESNKTKEKIVDDNIIKIPFDMLHLAPPQVAPKFVKESVLADDSGWLDVNHHSLQHNTFKNIFGLGDVASLPTGKTGAAIRKQVPVVVDNILRLLQGRKANNGSYNGYSSCPMITAYGKMALAEFDYHNNFTPDPKLKQMLIFDSSKEHWRLWILKKYILPYLYWNKILKGKKV
ncbi:NAD(P)/FAD-dependent oxidoreductase [Aquimarina celericrescens]|uniref:FAD/NAD(P)-binding oxidoreductase n=1 Tax=Aquimarina celericrescens TaxID=1964542 RepID=A0ABW5ARU1_9FLAO|nr:NAD(P)/FAD-dependent oxidoreductase [Aquimarina celericrescens]